MGLLDRLIGTELPKVSVHQFTAALGEWERGKTTRAEVIAFFGISVAEEATLDALKAKIVPVPDSYSLGGTVTMTGIGTTYDAAPAVKGLGFIALEGAGISGLEWRLRYNKVGTGTLDIQLWNETTGSELAKVSDAVVGDNKNPAPIIVTPGTPLASGMHFLRVRAQNSTTGQAPIYYGSTLRILRVNVLWSKILEEVCVLAEKGYPTVDTVAKLGTQRLGI